MFIYFQTNPNLKIPQILKLSMLRKIRMGWFNPTSVFLNLPKVDGSFDWGNSSSSDTPKDHIDHIVGFICWVYMPSYCIIQISSWYSTKSPWIAWFYTPIGAQTMPWQQLRLPTMAPRTTLDGSFWKPGSTIWWMVHQLEKSWKIPGGYPTVWCVYISYRYIYIYTKKYLNDGGIVHCQFGMVRGIHLSRFFPEKCSQLVSWSPFSMDFPDDFKAAAPVFLNPMVFCWDPLRDPWSNHSNPPRDQRRLPKPPMMPEHLPENPQEGAKSAGSVSPGAKVCWKWGRTSRNSQDVVEAMPCDGAYNGYNMRISIKQELIKSSRQPSMTSDKAIKSVSAQHHHHHHHHHHHSISLPSSTSSGISLLRLTHLLQILVVICLLLYLY